MQRWLHYNAKNVSTNVSHLLPKVATRISTSLYLCYCIQYLLGYPNSLTQFHPKKALLWRVNVPEIFALF